MRTRLPLLIIALVSAHSFASAQSQPQQYGHTQYVQSTGTSASAALVAGAAGHTPRCSP